MKSVYICFFLALFLLLLINAKPQIPATGSRVGTNRHPAEDRNTNEVKAFAKDSFDLSAVPLATQGEIDTLNNILENQIGVGVLGGDNTKPFYHINESNKWYVYQKRFDPSRLPAGFIAYVKDKWPSILVGDPVSLRLTGYMIEVTDKIKDALFGRASTEAWIDCWVPAKENKVTVCGKAEKKSFVCDQDELHTKLTVDKDINLDLVPGKNFEWVLNNPWLTKARVVETEVKATNLFAESTTPHNPLLLQIPQYLNVCVYGPWMADILDIEGVDYHLQTNDEVHPINQLWYKKGEETQLIAIADETAYFEKTGGGGIEASGLNHAMRFYIAFHIPAHFKPHHNSVGLRYPEYDINGVGFDFTDNPDNDIQTRVILLKNHDEVRMKINDNSFVKLQKTHNIFFEQIRTRPDGSFQGYIVVETVPIVKRGGSINISVVDKTAQRRDLEPRPIGRQ
jgi:hypothetical protein